MVRTARESTPRRMEEASVAGESPDRSKQQKSSGTARSESDPRLAVFREESAGGEGGGATDTATAVLRTGSSGDGDGGDEGADAQGTGNGKADTATAVFRTPSSVRTEGSGGSDGDTDDSDVPDGSDAAGRAAEGREDAESQAAGEGSKGSDGAADADAVKPEPGDARLREAVAAWVAKEEGPRSGDDAVEPAAAEDAGADRTDGEEVDSEAAGASGKDAGSGAAEAGTDTTAEGDVDDADDAEGADAGRTTEPGAKSESGTGPEAGKPDSRPAAGTEADEADSEAVGEAEEEDKGSRNSGDSKADADEAPRGDTETKGDKDAKNAKAADKEAKGDERGVDQPTAVFRTPAAGVDQPTTALKVTPPPSRTRPGSEPKPESDAERTSKFVPLRQDDIRPAKEPAAAPVATPGARPAAPSFVTAERTTQQPMPPKPPLDLLAELTNTPPPPDTPVRVAVRRVKIWTPLVLLLLIVFAIVQTVRPLPDPELQMSAKPTYTFKGSKPSLPWPDEGQGYMAATGLGEVDSFGEQKAVPIGSVAKAMTAYIVLKDHPLKKGEKGPSIKVDAKAEADGKLDAEGESTLNTVKASDTLTEQEALAAIMIPSANNIARLLARWDAGSEEAFVKKMNDTAKSLGMKNTTYTDPSGLTATTVSSAEDQVKLGQKLVEIPALMAITKLPSWTDPSGKNWRNYNTLVPYDGALGIKTGSTTKAGGNLLFAAHKMVGDTDQLIVGAVLGQHKPPIIDTVNAVSKEAMLATQDLLENAKVVKKGDVVGTVSDGLGGSISVIATKDVSAVGWPGLTVKIELTDDGKAIPHSASAGTRVGTLTVGEGTSQVKVPVALQSDLVEPTFGQKLTRLG
ncbi:D-alanyl-D-alanine carboxypeptidase [Streptomyces sp. NPDC032161]|uniref:D-alanyl-D-alanine carboxypeptidase n=1 Tax=unclassified Streptomyces TaxID=2593676 RepID=UPI0033DDD01B